MTADDVMADAPDEVREYWESLPKLPGQMSAFSGGLWAMTVLLQAAVERDWSRDQLRQSVLLLMSGVLTDSGMTDEQVLDEMRVELARVRASRSVKQ